MELAIKKKHDVFAWNSVVDQVLSDGDHEKIKNVFKKVTEFMPDQSSYYLKWLQYEQAKGDTEAMETIFNEVLPVSFSVALWNFYLGYVVQAQAQSPEVIQSAYEFALSQIGNDLESGGIWLDYIAFVKEGFTTSTFEEQQKMETIRKLYQRAVKVPLSNIEYIWKDYDTFENNLNKTTVYIEMAKKFIQDSAGPYMTARAALRELKGFFDAINALQKNWVAKPVSWNDKEVKLITAWKRYIVWEMCNPMELEDKNALHGRIMFAFKASLTVLRFFPEIWYDCSQYLVDSGKMDEAVQIMRNALEINPKSLLLNFNFAEVMESAKYEYSHVASLFDTLIEKLEAQYATTNTEFDAERAALIKSLEAMAVPETETDEWDGERREEEREAQKMREKEVDSKIEVRRKRELRKQSQAITLTWIVYMRTARRMQNMKTARSVFSKARKSPLCTYHIFVASAYMEFFCNKDPVVAGKVFEVGMRNMDLGDEDSPLYVMHYLDFLTSMNDENNTRALFERAVTGIPAARCRDIWEKWLDYENQYGDIGNAGRVFQRVKEIYPDDINSGKNLYYLANRWKVLNLNVVGDFDLGLQQTSLHARKIGPISTVSKALDEKVKRLASLEAVNPENYPRPDFGKYVLYKPEAALVDSMADDLPTIDFDVPEPITNFLKLLPTPKQYIGPRLPPDDVLTLLTQLPIPVPVKQEAIAPPLPAVAPVAVAQPTAPIAVAQPAAPVPAQAPPNGASNPAPSQRVDPRLKRKAEGGDDQATSKIKKEEG